MRLRYNEEFYGPGGFGSPEDIEIFNQIADGLEVESIPWVLLHRGLHRERVEGGIRISNNSDETAMRGQYAEWKRLLHHFYDPFPVVSHYSVVAGCHADSRHGAGAR